MFLLVQDICTCFDHFYVLFQLSLNPAFPSLPAYPTSTKAIRAKFCCPNILVYLESGWLMGATFLKTDFPSPRNYQLPVTPVSEMGTSHSTPLSMLGFGVV